MWRHVASFVVLKGMVDMADRVRSSVAVGVCPWSVPLECAGFQTRKQFVPGTHAEPPSTNAGLSVYHTSRCVALKVVLVLPTSLSAWLSSRRHAQRTRRRQACTQLQRSTDRGACSAPCVSS